jgi:hypothetical protein
MTNGGCGQVSVSAGDAGSSSTGLFIEVLNKYLYFYSAGNEVRRLHPIPSRSS